MLRISTFIGQFFSHFLQLIHLSGSSLIWKRAKRLAESPVVFADKSQCNANNIVYKIADEKTVPHNLFNVLDMKQKKAADKNQGTDKNNIADESPFSAGRCGRFKRQ